MTRYAVGQPIRLSTVVTDAAGTAADPTDLSVSLFCHTDSSTTTYAYAPGDIVRDSTGHFHLDITTLTVAGHYSYAWLSTGSNAGVGPVLGNFDLYAPLTFAVVSVEETRGYLRLVEGSDSAPDDARLLTIITGVTEDLLQLIGPMVPTTYTEAVYAAGNFVLANGPIRTVTSVTGLVTGTASVTLADLITLPGNVLSSRIGMAYWGWYTVVYQAGPDTVPDDVRGAALDWILHRWRQSQSHGSATYGDVIPDFTGPPNSVMNQIRHRVLTRSGM